jgi:hypothetical protein
MTNTPEDQDAAARLQAAAPALLLALKHAAKQVTD